MGVHEGEGVEEEVAEGDTGEGGEGEGGGAGSGWEALWVSVQRWVYEKAMDESDECEETNKRRHNHRKKEDK